MKNDEKRSPDDKSSNTTSAPNARLALISAGALAIGVGLGWAGREARADDTVHSEDATVAVDSESPCEDWPAQICEETTPGSASCSNVQAVAAILPEGACRDALGSVPATLEKIEEARAVCNELVTKLCGELGAESQGCQMVKAKLPSIPAQGCSEMMTNYPQILAQLKQLGQAPPGGPGVPPGGPGAPPGGQGAPPGGPGAPPGGPGAPPGGPGAPPGGPGAHPGGQGVPPGGPGVPPGAR